MLFSIIVPVYNAEKSLDRCLESLEKQEFKNFEVIMIDDGSTDKSKSICEKYITSDSRFKYLFQTNRGPSAARNKGLKAAEGDVICFVDSDDFVSENYLKELYDVFDNDLIDSCFFGYYRVRQLNKDTVIPSIEYHDTASLYELSKEDMFGYTWIKCFSRKCVENQLFPEDMMLFEDEVFTCRALGKARKITVLPKAIYYYMDDNPGMLTKRTHADYCELNDKLYQSWKELSGSGMETCLKQKANAFVERCEYYGLEHKLDIPPFFESLRNTAFFAEHTNWSSLDTLISRKRWSLVRLFCLSYNIKNKIFCLYSQMRKKK